MNGTSSFQAAGGGARRRTVVGPPDVPPPASSSGVVLDLRPRTSSFRFAVFTSQTSQLVRVAQEAGASDEAIYEALFGSES